MQVCLCAALLAGCATEQKAPEQGTPLDAATPAQKEQIAKYCSEPVTGSNLRRCERSGNAGNTQSISREDYERAIPGGPGLTRSIIKTGN